MCSSLCVEWMRTGFWSDTNVQTANGLLYNLSADRSDVCFTIGARTWHGKSSYQQWFLERRERTWSVTKSASPWSGWIWSGDTCLTISLTKTREETLTINEAWVTWLWRGQGLSWTWTATRKQQKACRVQKLFQPGARPHQHNSVEYSWNDLESNHQCD